MAIDTRLLKDLQGAIFLLHFDPIRVECLSNNKWSSAFQTDSLKDNPLNTTVDAIELIANIEEQSADIFRFLSDNPTQNYSGFFSPRNTSGNLIPILVNASVASKTDNEVIQSCLCIVLDFTNNPSNVAVIRNGGQKLKEKKISMDQFSPREQEVIAEMSRGLTSKEIAKKLFITENTVETHRGRIFKKAGVSNVVSLVVRMP